MPTPRIYSKDFSAQDKTTTLKGQPATHIIRVLRLKTGDSLELFNGDNLQCSAKITHIDKQCVELSINNCQQVSRESPISITLIQAIPRGERMDWILQKTTELGVSRIIPLISNRSVIKLDKKRTQSRIQHWQGVITHACEQCGRNKLPCLEDPVSDLASALHIDQSSQRYFLDPDSRLKPRGIPSPPESICLVVGPEGGLDDSEKKILADLRVQGLVMGPRILRTETAGITALSTFGTLWGDL